MTLVADDRSVLAPQRCAVKSLVCDDGPVPSFAARSRPAIASRRPGRPAAAADLDGAAHHHRGNQRHLAVPGDLDQGLDHRLPHQVLGAAEGFGARLGGIGLGLRHHADALDGPSLAGGLGGAFGFRHDPDAVRRLALARRVGRALVLGDADRQLRAGDAGLLFGEGDLFVERFALGRGLLLVGKGLLLLARQLAGAQLLQHRLHAGVARGRLRRADHHLLDLDPVLAQSRLHGRQRLLADVDAPLDEVEKGVPLRRVLEIRRCRCWISLLKQ